LQQELQFPFIDCLERTVGVLPFYINMYLPFWVDIASNFCAKNIGVDLTEVRACMSSDEGNQLQHEIA